MGVLFIKQLRDYAERVFLLRVAAIVVANGHADPGGSRAASSFASSRLRVSRRERLAHIATTAAAAAAASEATTEDAPLAVVVVSSVLVVSSVVAVVSSVVVVVSSVVVVVVVVVVCVAEVVHVS
mmetsp:Transcript_6869/g.29264  ORF Transcript_6869/g.29264 Transcript_6869/m.29264 type:complete len:125 (-) Transcript_6869:1719-2093(-)